MRGTTTSLLRIGIFGVALGGGVTAVVQRAALGAPLPAAARAAGGPVVITDDVPSLVAILQEQTRQDRNQVAACRRLARLGPAAADAVPALAAVARTGQFESRGAAAMALGLIGPGAKPAVPTLVAMMQGDSNV